MASDIGNETRRGWAGAADTASDAAGKAKNAAVDLGNAAIETGKTVADAATETYRRGARATEYMSRTTSEQPLLALLIAGAVGYVIARVLHR